MERCQPRDSNLLNRPPELEPLVLCCLQVLPLPSGHLSAGDSEQEGRGSVTLLEQSWEHSLRATQLLLLFLFFGRSVHVCEYRKSRKARGEPILGHKNFSGELK